jgi:hypothetical protein
MACNKIPFPRADSADVGTLPQALPHLAFFPVWPDDCTAITVQQMRTINP